MRKKSIAIFASGSGTNAINIYNYFKNCEDISIDFLVCNNSRAGVLEKFENTSVDILKIVKYDLSSEDFLIKLDKVDLIVLAGFLVLIPQEFVKRFENKIVNIHPSLLPKYGGKGMYGEHIHKAVLENKEIETGITIHYVNEEFDKGEIIFQTSCQLSATDDLEEVKVKIAKLEMEHFPKVIESLLID